MTEAGSSRGNGSAAPVDAAQIADSGASRAGVAAASLIVGAQANAISAESAVEAGSPQNTAQRPSQRPHLVRRARGTRPPRRRLAGLSPGPTATAQPAPEPPAPSQPEETAKTNTNSELRDWVKENSTLISNASLLISISALALGLLPDTGVLDPYIKALIFGAALLLLAELHHQWPDDLKLHMFRGLSLPENHSWRMTAFAFLMQLATLVFAVWAILNTPLILAPLTAIAVVLAFRQWYFRRFRGVVARGFGMLALVAALLLSELLMVIVWAVVAGENITIEFWAEERPGLTIEY